MMMSVCARAPRRIVVVVSLPDGPDTPTVRQHPDPAVDEERLTLSCASDSLPRATFTWEFQGFPPGPRAAACYSRAGRGPPGELHLHRPQ